jgi:hypothetical protein
VLTAVPDRRRRPSDGLVAEASIVARLLGIRLLTLRATVVVCPADVTAPAASGSRAARPGPRPPLGSPAAPAARPGPPARTAGRGLAEAVRALDESAAILAASRRDGRPAARRQARAMP